MAIGADNKGVLIQEAAIQSRKLEKKAARGTVFLIGYLGISLSLRMLSNVVLARLFSPEYFGLMTLLTTVLVGLTLFSHIGLQDSVIQNPRGDEPVFLNTVWTLQFLRGSGLWLMTILLAWPVALFYHEPRMIALFPVLGLGSVIGGLCLTEPSYSCAPYGRRQDLVARTPEPGCQFRCDDRLGAH